MKKISVLIPAKNEQEYIESCLKSLRTQSIEKSKYEVIVADNQSTDSTLGIAEQYADRAFTSAANSIGRLRNELASNATGEILVYLDADCTVDSDYLESIANHFDNNSETHIIGGYINAPENAPILVRGWSPPKNEPIVETKIAATGSMAIRRSSFLILEGFNENIAAGEDTEICTRATKKGLKIILHPKASVVHHGFPSTMTNFVARQFWQTKDYLRTRKKGIDLVFVASALNLTLVILLLISLLTRSWPLFSAAIGMQILTIFGITVLKALRVPEKRLQHIIPIMLTTTLYLYARTGGLTRSLFKELTRGAKRS